MTSLQTNPSRMLRCSLLIATIILSLNLIAALTLHSQQLQRGISVEMAETHNATAFPEADNLDAWIVAITRDGSIYFGLDKMTPEMLLDKMKSTPRNRTARLYIKASARAPFSAVKPVLVAARDSYFEAPVLLTSDPEPARHGKIIPPKGLEVLVKRPENAPFVQLSLEGESSLTMDGNTVSWPALRSTLKTALHEKGSNTIHLEADDTVPFATVVRAVDEARAQGATVVLPAFHSI